MAKKTTGENKDSLKKILTILFYILLVGNLVVVGFAYVKNNFSNPLKFLSRADKNIETSNKIELPIPLSNSAVINAYLGYNFSGSVKEVKKIDSGAEIILETSEKGLPQFIVTEKDVKIFKIGQDKSITSAGIDDLRKGAHVSISTTYDLKTHLWISRTVHIVD